MKVDFSQAVVFKEVVQQTPNSVGAFPVLLASSIK